MNIQQPLFFCLFLLCGATSIVSPQETPPPTSPPVLEDPQNRDSEQLLKDARKSRIANRLQEAVVLGYLALRKADQSSQPPGVMNARIHLFLSEAMGEIGYRAFERIHAKAAYREWEGHEQVRMQLEPGLFQTRLGIVAMRGGEFSIADYHLNQALEGYQVSHQPNLIGEIVTRLHLFRLALKKANVSRELDKEGLAIIQTGHDHLDAAYSLMEKVTDHPEITPMIDELQGEFLLRLSSHLPIDKRAVAHKLLEQAESVFRNALEKHQIVPDTFHPDQVGLLNSLSSVMRRTGRYEEAMDLSEQVLTLTEQRQRGDPEVIFNMALTAAHLKNGKLLSTLCNMVMDLEYERIREVSTKSSEGLSLAYLSQGRHQSMVCLSLLSQTASLDNIHARLMLDLILRRKAIVAESEYSFWKTLHGQADRDLKSGRKNLVAYRNRLSTQVAKGDYRELWRLINFIEGQEAILAVEPWWRNFQRQPSDDPERKFVTNYAEAMAKGEGSWNATSSKEEQLEDKKVTVSQIAASLPSDAVIVEFNKIDDFDIEREVFSPSAHYWALILFPSGLTKALDLGLADSLERQITNSVKALYEGDPLLHTPQFVAMSELYQTVWAPLTKTLGDIKKIILSPDDALALVPFGALLDPNGHFLVEDHTLYQVETGRKFSSNEEVKDSKLRKSVIVADPNYGSVSDSIVSGGITEEVAGATPRFLPLPQLEATLNEGKMVEQVLGDNVLFLTGNDASETSVRTVEEPWVFHLATHGLFSNKSNKGIGDNVNKEDSAALHSAYVRHVQSLSRSGLALSGFNSGGMQKDEDGLLSAFDVTGMNLSGTNLVVLSGCDTGLGDTFAGEGVMGLRRAFQIAGARYVVMSLWQLSDREAVRQMRTFYQAYIEGSNPVLALRDMQRSRISWLRNALGEAPPALWGAFTIQGV